MKFGTKWCSVCSSHLSAAILFSVFHFYRAKDNLIEAKWILFDFFPGKTEVIAIFRKKVVKKYLALNGARNRNEIKISWELNWRLEKRFLLFFFRFFSNSFQWLKCNFKKHSVERALHNTFSLSMMTDAAKSDFNVAGVVIRIKYQKKTWNACQHAFTCIIDWNFERTKKSAFNKNTYIHLNGAIHLEW